MRVQILRAFDKRFKAGDVVDASDWRSSNLQALIRKGSVLVVGESQPEKRKPGRPKKDE